MSDGFDREAKIVRRGRKDGPSEARIMGYESPEAETVKGDDEAPYHKNPPFPSDLFRNYLALLETEAIPGDGDLTAIGVEQRRGLLLFVEFTTPGDAVDQELLIRLDALRGAEEWFPTAVIDSTLVIPAPPISATRDVYASIIRIPFPGVGITIRMCIPYDVSFYETVRFHIERTGEGIDPAINLGYRLNN
jgi:hypothetical protein